MLRALFRPIWIASAVIAIAGCSSKSTVTGKVLYKDKPVGSGTVSIVGADGIPHAGSIGPDGSYSVNDVPAGAVKIGVSSTNPDTGARTANGRASVKGGEGDAGETAPEPKPATPKSNWVYLPDQYADPNQSGLTGTVKGDTVINLDLKPL